MKSVLNFLFGKPVYQFEAVTVGIKDTGEHFLRVQSQQDVLEELNQHLRNKAYAYMGEQFLFTQNGDEGEGFASEFKTLLNIKDGFGDLSIEVNYQNTTLSRQFIGYLRDQTYDWLTRRTAAPAVMRGRERHATQTEVRHMSGAGVPA